MFVWYTIQTFPFDDPIDIVLIGFPPLWVHGYSNFNPPSLAPCPDSIIPYCKHCREPGNEAGQGLGSKCIIQ